MSVSPVHPGPSDQARSRGDRSPRSAAPGPRSRSGACPEQQNGAHDAAGWSRETATWRPRRRGDAMPLSLFLIMLVSGWWRGAEWATGNASAAARPGEVDLSWLGAVSAPGLILFMKPEPVISGLVPARKPGVAGRLPRIAWFDPGSSWTADFATAHLATQSHIDCGARNARGERRARIRLVLSDERAGRAVARLRMTGSRGRSGLRRAGWSATPTRGDPRDSATENRPPPFRAIALGRR